MREIHSVVFRLLLVICAKPQRARKGGMWSSLLLSLLLLITWLCSSAQAQLKPLTNVVLTFVGYAPEDEFRTSFK